VIYAGSVTGLYLLEEMVRFFLALRAREPNAFLRILTHASSMQTVEALERMGLRDGDFWVGAVTPEEVSTYLRQAHLGLSFRRPTVAQVAACPTKIPEYLAAGLPVVCSAGVGDMDAVLERGRVGVVVRDGAAAGYGEAAELALSLARDPHVSRRCRETARRLFDLEAVGGPRYRRVYRRLVAEASTCQTSE